MSNIVSRFINEHRWEIEGQIDLSAAAAVTAFRGSAMTAAKTATGTYTVTIAGSEALKLVEILDSSVDFTGTVPATATGCRISSVTQSSSGVANEPIVITIKTMASPTTGADTDTTAATTLTFRVVLRVGKMGAWT